MITAFYKLKPRDNRNNDVRRYNRRVNELRRHLFAKLACHCGPSQIIQHKNREIILMSYKNPKWVTLLLQSLVYNTKLTNIYYYKGEKLIMTMGAKEINIKDERREKEEKNPRGRKER
ncbi:hypothetical protein LguiB_024684 [Lonicera macranthoides]